MADNGKSQALANKEIYQSMRNESSRNYRRLIKKAQKKRKVMP
jgi:hypothetical protein